MLSKIILLSAFLASQAVAAVSTSALGPNPNNKRGLVFMPNKDFPNDFQLWTKSGSPLSWYYNYGSTPSSQLASSGMSFVPMAWGSSQAVNLIPDVEKLLAAGTKVSHVLGFNEPDMPSKWGGSDLTASAAATAWKTYIQPLAAKGIKLGSPAVSGATAGFTWVQDFMKACDGCTIDFLALHWYGGASSLQAHLEQYHNAYPNLPIWVTEFADAKDTVASTATNFNASLIYLDNASYVESYSYFGGVRASTSNVGPNAALIDDSGKLNSIGGVYMANYQGSGAAPAKPTTVSVPSKTAAPSSKPTSAHISTASAKPKTTSSVQATKTTSTHHHHHSHHTTMSTARKLAVTHIAKPIVIEQKLPNFNATATNSFNATITNSRHHGHHGHRHHGHHTHSVVKTRDHSRHLPTIVASS